jgi:pericentriolar material 1 protein
VSCFFTTHGKVLIGSSIKTFKLSSPTVQLIFVLFSLFIHAQLLKFQQPQRTRTESVNDSTTQSVEKCTKGRSEPPRPARAALQEVQVTFQDPLETVVSNEELFDRMRQQRILREELRERKKELEQFMRKGNDRPRRHYGRNQDNQSDNVSYSNKSYQDG